MFKNKLLNIMLIIIVALTLIGVVALVVIMNLNKDSNEVKEPSIDEIVEYSTETEKITTNLLDNHIVILQFKIQTDSVDAKEELDKRMFQVKNFLIQELASMESDQFKGKDGLIEVENIIKMRINEVMQEGTVEKVYIIDFILQ